MIVFNFKGHLSFAIYTLTVIYAAKFYFVGISFTESDLVFCIFCLVGSAAPDVDHEKAVAGHIIPAWKFLKHGGATHTLLFSSVFLGIALGTRSPAWAGFWVGFVSHLAIDHMDGNKLKHLWFPLNVIFKKKRRRRRR